MADATVSKKYEGIQAEENLLLFVDEGVTYVSKLGAPKIVQMTNAAEVASAETGTYWNVYVDPWLNCTISGRTITFHTSGGGGSAMNGGGSAVFVSIYGRI